MRLQASHQQQHRCLICHFHTKGSATSKLLPIQKKKDLCTAPAFCFSTRCTIQLPGIPAHSQLQAKTTAAVLRPRTSAAQTHIITTEGRAKKEKKNTTLSCGDHFNSHVAWSRLIFFSHLNSSHHLSCTPRPSIHSNIQRSPLKTLAQRLYRMKMKCCLTIIFFSFSFTILTSTLQSVSLCLFPLFLFLSQCFLCVCVSSRRGGLIQVNSAVSDWPELHWWTLPFFFPEESLCFFCFLFLLFADPEAVITVVKQDGRDARRQSAAPASLYCLSLWLAAESKSPAHAFWLMKTPRQWRTPRNSSDLW